VFRPADGRLDRQQLPVFGIFHSAGSCGDNGTLATPPRVEALSKRRVPSGWHFAVDQGDSLRVSR
jgi:hypothetical protein